MRRTIARELIDDPIADPDELAGNLRDIARANRTFGAYRPIVRPLLGCGVRTVLDVGSGAGDVPLALV
ncbi:MAG: methyltransferase, partial [Candidatus Eremiobacteraeota bacterium]|nr:methyltransferase [Candidatus Eremiobacteraeota bacterium]